MAVSALSPVLCPRHEAENEKRREWARRYRHNAIVRETAGDLEAQTFAILEDEEKRQKRAQPTKMLIKRAEREATKSQPIAVGNRRRKPEWLAERRERRRELYSSPKHRRS